MEKGRPIHEFYHFFRDANNRYLSSTNHIVTDSPFPYPLTVPPTNFIGMKVSMGTNDTYSSLVRSVTLLFNFVEDGADILREFKYNRGGFSAELYYLIIRYDYRTGIYRKYYEGRFDFKKAKDNRIKGYSIPCVDTSILGILLQNDTVQYQIDCSPQNPKAIPVLLDGTNLQARFTYQPVNQTFFVNNTDGTHNYPFVAPIVLVNTDGDSSGSITQNESFAIINDVAVNYFPKNNANFFYKTAKPQQLHIKGDISFQFKMSGSGAVTTRIVFTDFFSDRYVTDIPIKEISMVVDNAFHSYTVPIDAIIDLLSGETLAISFINLFPNFDGFFYLFNITNIIVEVVSKPDASITWALRPLDLFQAIVEKATKGQYTVNSNFYTTNNKLVCTAGNSIRLAPNAYIKASFQDCFKSYDTEHWLAGRVIDNQLWIEPFKIVYDQTTDLFVLGQMSESEIIDAEQYLFNQVEVGSPKQDYRHTSGRLEFNGTNKFAVYLFNIKKTLDLKSIFRKDGFGVTFIQLDYQQQSTVDNSGDDSVFMLDITDQKDTSGVPAENFSNVQVNITPLSPIIYYPFSNDTISNANPTIRGVCQPSTLLHIYTDGVLDGSVTSDINGNWIYNIVTALTPFVDGVTTGIHTIDATFTDETGTLSTVTVFITADTTLTTIQIDDSIYNNKPLLKGFAQAGTVVTVSIDRVVIGTATADGSCRWFFQSPLLSNGSHVINGKTVNVNSFTDVPLITSFEYGFQIVNNLPVINGVALPGTKVDLWLNYYPDVALGTTFADANGNWSIPIVPLFKTGGIDVLTPIPNGSNILSTSLEIKSAIISISGYKLNRPAYSSVEGVLDQTVFNTRLTPKRNMLTRLSLFKSVFYQQPNTIIEFSSGDKNQGFATTLLGTRIKENDNIQLNQYLDAALFLPYIISGKIETPFFFVDTMNSFSSGGLVKVFIEENEVICLPIGEMTVEDVTNDIQTWKLLISALTPLSTLLKLSTPGATFTFMENSIYRSDYNMLHFVSFVPPSNPKYKSLEIYDDLFEDRNDRWLDNPKYVQKIQNTDACIEQIVATGITGTIILNAYNTETGKLVQSYNYSVVTPAPIPFPDIVQECIIDFSVYADGEYAFIIFVAGVPIAISQNISIADSHEGTILIESTHSRNKTGAFFSTGFTSVIRVEGLIEKSVANIDDIISEDDAGNFINQHSVFTQKRTMLLYYIPDWLYLKICAALTLDTLKIEGVDYVLSKDAKLDPVEKTAGHPMYYYNIDLQYKNNIQAAIFPSPVGTTNGSVILVVDAGAFGMGGGGLTEIELKPE